MDIMCICIYLYMCTSVYKYMNILPVRNLGVGGHPQCTGQGSRWWGTD